MLYSKGTDSSQRQMAKQPVVVTWPGPYGDYGGDKGSCFPPFDQGYPEDA